VLLAANFLSEGVSEIHRRTVGHDSVRRRLVCGDTAGDGERYRLLSALRSTDWNKSKAAQQLHWSRMTLYRKMAKYAVTTPLITDAAATDREKVRAETA
jgi:transcriptional regulator of acetoin/glycerol metabolism